jgi:hypothetical protein
MITLGQPAGDRIYTHAHTPLDLKQDYDIQNVRVVLRRGATVKGRVVGPDGRPVAEAGIITPLIIGPRPNTWLRWIARWQGTVRDGRFALHGLEPDTEVPVYFLEPKGQLGGVVNLSAKSAAGGPVTVRLEPCGAARARIVDPDGKAIAGPLRGLVVLMVVTPGPDSFIVSTNKSGLVADRARLTLIDPVNYQKEPAVDADGRIALPVLIPGATYRVLDTRVIRGGAGPALRKEFTVKPGETLDLGDIGIEKPPR